MVLGVRCAEHISIAQRHHACVVYSSLTIKHVTFGDCLSYDQHGKARRKFKLGQHNNINVP